MANINVYVLRNSVTYAIIALNRDGFVPGGGEDVAVESVPEEDVDIFTQKYRYDGLGVLEINGKRYYFLELSNDAIKFNASNGMPQLDVGGQDFLTLTFNKKDIQGNYHTAVGDTDRIYLTVDGGEGQVEWVDLVAGSGSGQIYSSTVRGLMKISLGAVDIVDNGFAVESV